MIKGKDSGAIVLRYINAYNKTFLDTAMLVQGHFEFKGSVNGGSYAYLNTDPFHAQAANSLKNYDRNLFVGPGVIEMVFEQGSIEQAAITGTGIQRDWESFRSQESQDLKKLSPFLSAIDSVRMLLRAGSISSQLAEQEIRQLQKHTAPIYASLLTNRIAYIQKNPANYISLHLLEYVVSHIPDEQVDRLYLQLTDAVKNSSMGYGFTQYYARYKQAMDNDFPFDQMEMNKPAPSFVIYQKANDSLTLSQLKGTVGLLEFWELACLPCLKANPLIEELRKQYSDADFKVFPDN